MSAQTQEQVVAEVVDAEVAEVEEKSEKSWLDVYESQTEWRAIRGDSFVVNKEAAAGTFELVCAATGNVLYCEVAGRLVEVYRDSVTHGSLESAMHEGRKVWSDRDKLLRDALKSSKSTEKGKKREKVSLAAKVEQEGVAAILAEA